MTVEREDLERLIQDVAAEVRDPRAGIYGPGTVAWRVARESIVFLGAGRASLLQLAHPYVAHAVDQHSHTRDDPVGRFRRTFLHVYAIVFGDLDHALSAARRVHGIHTRIRGEIGEDVGRYRRGARYEANEEQALFWVHATLIDTSVQVYELCVGPLSPAEKERHYRETCRFARLFGISREAMPPTWQAFREHFDRTCASDGIAVGAVARDIGRYLLHATPPALEPIAAWYRTITAGLLPPRVRDGYGLRFDARDEVAFRASARAIRAVYPRLPRRLRWVPAYATALRRVRGMGPDPLGEAVGRVGMRVLGAVLRPEGAR